MRHRQRHVHATIVKLIRDGLTADGWIDAPVNFGTTPISVIDYQPLEAGETPAFNTVAVSIGHEGEDAPVELGGGVYECKYTLFVDVYAINIPIGIAIADDIKALLTEAAVPLRDFTTSADGIPTAAQIEFETVVVEVIPTATTTLDKRTWRAVKATACCYF